MIDRRAFDRDRGVILDLPMKKRLQADRDGELQCLLKSRLKMFSVQERE